MDDLRWFAPNRYCTLPVPALVRAGLRIALEGDTPAAVAVAADGRCAKEAFEFSLRRDCPLVLYLWDLPPWRLESGRPDLIFEAGSRLIRVARPWGRHPERPGYYSRVRYIAGRAVEVWCPSHQTVEDVHRRFGIIGEHLPFCYDSERFTLETGGEGPAPSGDFTILSISRLVPHKNHAVLIRAASRLAPRPLVRILGQGPEAANLRQLAVELGVRCELHEGWASDEEVVAAYRAASVVVCPSGFEGFGLTPIEGLAIGVPVIASDIPPHCEFLNGAVRFFPPGDDQALAAEIAEVMAQPPHRPTLPSPLLSGLTIEACGDRMLPRLRRILGRGR